MNQFGVLTTPQECEGHEEWTYETIKKEGRYELELQFRAWYRKAFSMGLICYFLDKDGNHVNNSQGVGAVTYSYDETGLTSMKYYDLTGNPVTTE